MTNTCQHEIAPIAFKLGQIVLTRGVDDLINGDHELIREFMDRHDNCDWGTICEEDIPLNNEATHNGGRIMSQYEYNGTRLWIITESDRSVTTLLLPSEY